MGVMRIVDSTGDSVVTWAIDDPLSVTEAQAVFNRLAGERKMPFARVAGAAASDAERITAFDPAVEEIVWVRPIAGG
jgi:hypothetical protein